MPAAVRGIGVVVAGVVWCGVVAGVGVGAVVVADAVLVPCCQWVVVQVQVRRQRAY